MIDSTAVELARLQFGLTAMYHFLFVPLTLGLSVLLGIMETVYVITGRQIWRDMTRYWGVLFGINFAMGVATGITMEFQFGTNWAYYSHYVGDIFGAPLAIEGMMAFFLEASFIGLFFFGWERLSRLGHLVVTWLVALGSNLSALWILIANGWMQNPVGAHFDYHSMRMEVTNFAQVVFNPVAQAKFFHTTSAGYVTGSIFVMAISSWFLMRGRNVEFAKKSMTVAAAFGLFAALSAVALGDESGFDAMHLQPMKGAAIESEWKTEAAPADFTLFGIPNQAAHRTDYEVQIPALLGIIATRSTTGVVPGIDELVKQTEGRIRKGMVAYGALLKLRAEPNDAAAKATLAANVDDLGYGLLLRRFTNDVTHATPNQITAAAWSTVPEVLPLFWAFRFMVGLGFFFILYFASAFWLAAKRRLDRHPAFLRLSFWILPLPWIAAELGWFVAENGRQPWTINDVLPTYLSASSLGAGTVATSVAGFVIFYSALFVVEVYLMVKYIKLGPEYDKRPVGQSGAQALGAGE